MLAGAAWWAGEFQGVWTPLPLRGRGVPELVFGSKTSTITSTGTGMLNKDEVEREGGRAGRRCRSSSGGARMLAVALVDSGYGIR